MKEVWLMDTNQDKKVKKIGWKPRKWTHQRSLSVDLGNSVEIPENNLKRNLACYWKAHQNQWENRSSVKYMVLWRLSFYKESKWRLDEYFTPDTNEFQTNMWKILLGKVCWVKCRKYWKKMQTWDKEWIL